SSAAYAPSNTATTPAGTAGFCTLTRRRSSVNKVTVSASLVAAKRPNAPTESPRGDAAAAAESTPSSDPPTAAPAAPAAARSSNPRRVRPGVDAPRSACSSTDTSESDPDITITPWSSRLDTTCQAHILGLERPNRKPRQERRLERCGVGAATARAGRRADPGGDRSAL